MENHDELIEQLNCIFRARSVAVIGASRSPEKIGHQILRNLISGGYKGKIYPINPKAEEILGLKVYKRVTEIDDNVDLAVVAIPATLVPQVIEDCGKAGVKGVAVISSGFGEVGRKDLEEEIVRIARSYKMRIVGPNIVGVLDTVQNMNASFCPDLPLKGNIAFITQSGALGIALVGWTREEHIGLSDLVSIGNKADLDEVDLIRYFKEDPYTKVIAIYMEGIKDGRAFMNVAKDVTLKKPIVVLKVGWSEWGRTAVMSHTGSLAGQDSIFDAAFKQCGVIRARTLEELFDWSLSLSLSKMPEDYGTVIITNGGGAGIIATDSCEKYGIKLVNTKSHEDMVREFRKYMPPFGSIRNPIDLTGQADEDKYKGALEYALKDNRIKSLILLYCHTAITSPKALAEKIHEAVEEVGLTKPIVVSFIGGREVTEALAWLKEKGIPAFPSPERAVSAMSVLYRRMEYLRKISS
ncbi:MAG: acetate--CoA ligase alpha subunit [Candidatus Asgardarchaeia archaeon]